MDEDPRWRPVELSGHQRKAMDRVGGADLILPWPDGLPPGAPVGLNEERDATRAEHAAAAQIVGPACRQHGLVPVRTLVATLRRPPSVPRETAVEQHLIVRIIGRRWVHATGNPQSGECWASAERIERHAEPSTGPTGEAAGMNPDDRDFLRRAFLAFVTGAGLRRETVGRLLASRGIAPSGNRLRELGRDSDRGQSITPHELHGLISAWAEEQRSRGGGTPAYGSDPTADPAAEAHQLAHAIEAGYPWNTEDVVRVLDRASGEITRLSERPGASLPAGWQMLNATVIDAAPTEPGWYLARMKTRAVYDGREIVKVAEYGDGLRAWQPADERPWPLDQFDWFAKLRP